MPLDPVIQAILDAAPPFAPSDSVPIASLRAAVRAAMVGPVWDVPLASVVDRHIPGPGGPLAVRIYTPEGPAPFPIVIYFHGGGYVVGDLDTQDNIARALAHGAASIVISVDYRLAPENPFPAAPDDAWAATIWASEHAAEFEGDPARIAVAGDSAGGVLASAVTLRARDSRGPKLRAQVNFYGSCNYPSERRPSSIEFAQGPILTARDVAFYWSQYLADPIRDQHNPQASPYRAARHTDLPPAFIGTAECDPSRDDTEAYAKKLNAAGVEVTQVRYPGVVHGFVSWLRVLPSAQRAIDDACAFLRRHFRN